MLWVDAGRYVVVMVCWLGVVGFGVSGGLMVISRIIYFVPS